MLQRWKNVKVGDLVKIRHGFPFDGKYFSDKRSDKVLLTPGNVAIGGGFQERLRKYYHGPVPETFVFSPGDLFVSMTDLSKGGDTLGYPAIVPSVKGVRFLHNQRLGKVVPLGDGLVDLRFVYYFLRSKPYRSKVLASASGTTVRHTSPSRLEEISLPLPPLVEQQAIATFLGSLDDKINLNHRMNQTLEEMAQALYKSWFLDFDPVRARAAHRKPWGMDAKTAALFPDSLAESETGKVPRGWKITSLLDIADLLSGGTPPTSEPDFWDGGIPWVSGKDVTRAAGGYLLETERNITQSGVEGSATQLLPEGTVIITARGTVGALAILSKPMCMSQTSYGLKARNGVGDAFLRLTVASAVSGLQQQSYGTIFDTVTTKNLRATKVLLPSRSVLGAFSARVDPLMEITLSNLKQSRILAEVRDALLPKLLSGEIRVLGEHTSKGDS